MRLLVISEHSQGSPFTRFVDHILVDPLGTLTGLVHDFFFTWQGQTLLTLFGFALVVFVGRMMVRRMWRKSQHTGARWLTIHLPSTVDKTGAEMLWRNLTGLLSPAWKRWLLGQIPLALEYYFTSEGVQIGLWVPKAVPPGMAEHAITAAWPGTHVSAQSDQCNPAITNGSVAQGGALSLMGPEQWPLANQHDADPLRPLLEAGSALQDKEIVWVQILTRPTTSRRLHPLRAASRHQHNHDRNRLWNAPLQIITDVINEVTAVALPGPSSHTTTTSNPIYSPSMQAGRQGIRDKSVGPHWETSIRYLVAIPTTATDDKESVKAAHKRSRGLAHEIASTFSVYSGHNVLRRRKLSHPAAVLASRSFRRGFLLSIPELAALAHLPYDTTIPGLERAGARTVAPVSRIPSVGADITVLGDTDTQQPRPVGLSVADACHHIHIQGATGAGKSTLLAQMILSDAHARRGVLVLDPRGDLILDVLDRLPTSAADRVVLFDPDDPYARPRLNILYGLDSHVVTDNVVGIFRRIFADSWGPRTDDIFRAACLTLHGGKATLVDISDLLTNPTRRHALTARITEPILAGFWHGYNALSQPARTQAIAPLMNKLRAFLLRSFVRDTLCAPGDCINLGQLLDTGGICLVRLPKGSLGTDTTQLFGSLVLAKAWEATAHLSKTDIDHRRFARIYLDECHNFLTLPHDIADMLAENRGYRRPLVLAHQHQAQLPSALREGISANARNKIYFAMSPEDAALLSRHVAPQLSAHDLVYLGAFHAAARLIVNSAEMPAFTFKTRPLPPPIPGRAHFIRTRARTHHITQPRVAAGVRGQDPRTTSEGDAIAPYLTTWSIKDDR